MKHVTTAFAVAASVLALGAGAATAEKITIGLASEPTSIDPHFHNLGPNNALSVHIFDRLIAQDDKQRLSPGLAVSWKPIDDLTWEFKLREGVKFHDGTDFNADDVICTFERAPNVPNSPSGYGTYTKGKTLEKIDDYTVHFKTAEPYPLMGNDVSTIPIISDSVGCGGTTEEFNAGTAAVGTGPYKFVDYKPGESITLAINQDYWGEKPIWTEVEYRPIKSGPSRVAALLAGDVDMISGVPTTDIATLEANDDIQLSQGVSNRVIYLHLDQFRENSPFVKGPNGEDIKNPLLDQRVRKAISMAINRDAIVDRVMEGVAISAGQLLPDGFFGVSEKLQPVAYDPEGAKALMAEAGYPDGFQLTIHGPNDRYINDAKIAEAIGQMLTRVGIQTAVETMPRSVYFGRASSGSPEGLPEFSFILVGWGAGSGEASSPLKSLIHSYDKDAGFGSSNRGRHSDPVIDAKIEEALRTVDDDKRQALLAEATEMAIENVAIIPTHFQVNTWAAKKGLRYIPRTDEYTLVMGVVKE
ncbi:ABC transporter substrate-binding protein [Ovoidimarina sediminis]|uniref:ABC transporter substrate-binding protein n=1 Tax=Ovoidimarina sediminis TaxID=3079856 RepID=UPI00290888F1|nr:ABC transporter substrate-binding protein [Rhodophyticola sp. MJ-SS7]MDU8942084.1 ABC transporter substrate-binding protein [Rhodophyticola sp. MJ-SS7]